MDEVGNFNIDGIRNIRGTPWEPVPGSPSLHIPTNIEEDGKTIDSAGNVEGSVGTDEYKPSHDSGIALSQDIDSKDDSPDASKEREA